MKNKKKFDPHAYIKEYLPLKSFFSTPEVIYIPVIIIARTKCEDHWCDGEDCEFSPRYIVEDESGKRWDVDQDCLFMMDSLQGL